MRIWIYKRTHDGDPDKDGVFGIQDCMKRMRNYNYDAVIGVGGKTTFKGHEYIRQKLNWVGIGPNTLPVAGKQGPLVTFKHFMFLENLNGGDDIGTQYPHLHEYLYKVKSRARFIFVDIPANGTSPALPLDVVKDIQTILKKAGTFPPSLSYNLQQLQHPNPSSCGKAKTPTCKGCSCK